MKKFFLFVFLATMLLSACGSSGSPVVSTNLEVEMSEFMFNPKDLAAPAGKEITFNLKNDGAVAHDFVILKKGVIAKTPFNAETQKSDIFFEARLNPGKSGTYTFTLPETGDYEIICTIPGHLEAGMKANLSAR